MPFLKRDLNDEEPDSSDDLEEQYMRLMPKMGRDFIHKDDLLVLLQRILEIIDPTALVNLSIDDSNARNLAQHYKRIVEKGRRGEQHRDLVEIK